MKPGVADAWAELDLAADVLEGAILLVNVAETEPSQQSKARPAAAASLRQVIDRLREQARKLDDEQGPVHEHPTPSTQHHHHPAVAPRSRGFLGLRAAARRQHPRPGTWRGLEGAFGRRILWSVSGRALGDPSAGPRDARDTGGGKETKGRQDEDGGGQLGRAL